MRRYDIIVHDLVAHSITVPVMSDEYEKILITLILSALNIAHANQNGRRIEVRLTYQDLDLGELR